MVGQNLKIALISCLGTEMLVVFSAVSDTETQNDFQRRNPDLFDLLDLVLAEKDVPVGEFALSVPPAHDELIFEIQDSRLIERVLQEPLSMHLLSQKHFRDIEHRKGGRRSELIRAQKRSGKKR